ASATAAPAPDPRTDTGSAHHDEQHHADAGGQSFPGADVKRIELEINRADVVFSPSPDGNVYVYSDSPDDFRVSLDKNGRLTVESRDKNTLVLFGAAGEKPVLTVTLPAELGCALDAEVSMGSIQLENLSLGQVELDTDMGDVYVYGLACLSAELGSDCGSVQANSVTSSGGLSADADMGDVSVENCRAAGELDADSSCGKVFVSACSAADAEISAELGDVTVWELDCQRSIGIDCDCGAMEFKGLRARSIELENDMGSIEGRLPGSITDYSIESGVDMGSNSLPKSFSSGGSIRLKAYADCGSIDIVFEDD
ncbi:MAG: DUF4097 domain-containing protein, partial [Butyricicoccus sp.]|nr:DUF4097 domain-containing protein [Butyricicoccus sp.]